MENISLGQIVGVITFLSVFIGAITSLFAYLKKFISKILTPIDKKIDLLGEISSNGRNNIELELIKIILVNFMNDIENGIDKSQVQKQNAYELFDRYKSLGGNSYIKDNFQKLINDGKI